MLFALQKAFHAAYLKILFAERSEANTVDTAAKKIKVICLQIAY